MIHGGPTRPPDRARASACSTGRAAASPSSTSTTAARPATAARYRDAAAAAVGHRRRRGLRRRAPAASPQRGPGRPGAAVHPRRLGRRLHDAGRAGLRATSSRPAPATSASPTSRRSPATRTSSRAATSTGWSARTPRSASATSSGRRSTTSTAFDAPADRAPGAGGRGRAAGPVRDDRRRAAAQGRARRLPAFDGEQHGFRQAANIRAGAGRRAVVLRAGAAASSCRPTRASSPSRWRTCRCLQHSDGRL